MAKSARKQSTASNGSVNDLAIAFRSVVREAVEEAVFPMAAEMVEMEDRLTKRIDSIKSSLTARIDTTENNMSAQFAAHKKDFTNFKREIKQDLHDFKKQYKERPKQK